MWPMTIGKDIIEGPTEAEGFGIGLFVWAVKTPLRQTVLPSNKSIAMSTDSMHKCSQCKKFKPSDDYGVRERGGMHGRKGTRLAICQSCCAINRKRRRVASNADRPAKKLATQPPASPGQFVDTLAKHASASEIDDYWRVSLDEITLTDKGCADHIASLAWRATGYRFT